MIKASAEKVFAEATERFSGRTVQLETRGNPEARKAEIPQQFVVRFKITELDGDQLADLTEIAKLGEGEEITIRLIPVDQGGTGPLTMQVWLE